MSPHPLALKKITQLILFIQMASPTQLKPRIFPRLLLISKTRFIPLIFLTFISLNGQNATHSSSTSTPSNRSDRLTELKTLRETHPAHTLLLRVSTDKQTLTIGEKLLYSVTLIHPPELEIIKPDPYRDFGHFTVLNHQLLPTQIIDAQAHYTLRYTLTIYETGTFSIPPAEAIVLTLSPNNKPTQHPQRTQAQPRQALPPATTNQPSLPQPNTHPLKLTSLPISVQVTPLIKNPDATTEPFKPPFEITGKISTTVKGLFFCCIILIATFSMYWHRRRKIIKHIPPLPFYQQIQHDLDALMTTFNQHPPLKKLPSKDRNSYTVDFYDSLSHITRRYLSQKLNAPKLLACTTSELSHTHAIRTLPKQDLRTVLTFFKKADWIKFSGKEMSIRYALKFTEKLYAFTKADQAQASSEQAEKAASQQPKTKPKLPKN